jgi:hypothetical protein
MDIFMRGPSSILRHSVPLVDLLRIHNHIKCSDRLDRVYSLLAMSEEGQHIEVDYQSSRTSLLLKVLRLNKKRICLCLPTFLLGALNLASDTGLDADMMYASQERNRISLFP